MTVHISTHLENELRRLAGSSGKEIDALVEEAVQQYLIVSSITDVTPEELSATQMTLLPELSSPEPWPAAEEHQTDEAG